MHTRSIAFRGLRSVLTIAPLACLAGAASAQFDVSRFTIDGGGGLRAAGGTYAVSGTIGQPDAGRMSGATYSLNGGFWAGGGAVSGAPDASPDDGVDLPATTPLPFHIYPASPNPVAEQMVLVFDLPEARLVRASLYDAGGRLVRTLTEGPVPAGRHQRVWDRRDQVGARVPAGIYFVCLDAGAHRSDQKIVVVH